MMRAPPNSQRESRQMLHMRSFVELNPSREALKVSNQTFRAAGEMSPISRARRYAIRDYLAEPCVDFVHIGHHGEFARRLTGKDDDLPLQRARSFSALSSEQAPFSFTMLRRLRNVGWGRTGRDFLSSSTVCDPQTNGETEREVMERNTSTTQSAIAEI